MQQDDDRNTANEGAAEATPVETAPIEAPTQETTASPSHNTESQEEPQVLAVEGEAAPRQSSRRAAPVVDSSDDKVDSDGEDDETWTNLPDGGADTESHGSDDEESDEEEEDDTPVVTRKVIQNARDVICEELPVRAERAKLRLRPQLTGAFLIEVSNTGEKFIFDWRGQEPKVTPAEGPVELASSENSDPSKVDTIISLSDQHMMAIRSGDLNPQVAMLADKIRVKGKMGPAVYLFNLVAPRVRD